MVEAIRWGSCPAMGPCTDPIPAGYRAARSSTIQWFCDCDGDPPGYSPGSCPPSFLDWLTNHAVPGTNSIAKVRPPFMGISSLDSGAFCWPQEAGRQRLARTTGPVPVRWAAALLLYEYSGQGACREAQASLAPLGWPELLSHPPPRSSARTCGSIPCCTIPGRMSASREPCQKWGA